MSYPEFGGEVAEISEKSTIPELIGFLLSSFERKEFKLVEEMLINREEELKTQLKKEQAKLRLLEKIHGESALESLEIRDNLKRLENENLKLQEELEKLKREKVETAQTLLGYEERMTNIEKVVANTLSMDRTEIQILTCHSLGNHLQKEGSRNLDRKRTMENASNSHEFAQGSYGVQSPLDSPCFGANSSHQEKKSYSGGTLEKRNDLPNCVGNAEIGIEDSHDTPKVGTDCLKQENKNHSSYAAGCNDGTLEIREDLLNGHSNAQIGIEDACDTPKAGKDCLKQENGSDSSYPAASKSTKIACNRVPQSVVVEIVGSDDEASADEKPYFLNTCSSEINSSKKGVTSLELWSGCRTQNKEERNVRSNCFENLPPKRKRSLMESDDIGTSKKLDFLSSDDSSEYSSSDSDDKCSESFINKMIESLQQDRGKRQKTWNCVTDMQSEFLTNNELCMNAVCALYRKEISAEKSINLGSYLFGLMSGKDLAEYLIDGDPEYKLKRTVSEVQRKDPKLLHRCKQLAVNYDEILFDIYRKKEDPFFPPRL